MHSRQRPSAVVFAYDSATHTSEDSEVCLLKATKLNPFWCTFDRSSLEAEYQNGRWRTACLAIRVMAVSIIIVLLLTIPVSGHIPAKWRNVVIVGVIFNVVMIVTTVKRCGGPRLCWGAFAWFNIALTICATAISRDIAWDNAVQTGYELGAEHDSCVGDTVDPFAKWQVAHMTYFTQLVTIATLAFTKMPFTLSLPLAVAATAGLVCGQFYALGNTCFTFLIGYLAPCILVVCCMLIMLRSAEREHRHGFLHGKVNALSEVLVQQAQQRLIFAAQQEAKAEASKQVQQRFLATFSHELRTPLTAIIGNLDLLADITSKGATGTTHTELEQVYKQRALSSSHILLHLVNDILDLSRLQAGMLELNCRQFSLRDMLKGVEDMMQTLAERKKLHVTFVVNGTVPDALLGDRMRLQQVLINLVTNSVKFTPPAGHVAVEVTEVEGAANGNGGGVGVPVLLQVGTDYSYTQDPAPAPQQLLPLTPVIAIQLPCLRW